MNVCVRACAWQWQCSTKVSNCADWIDQQQQLWTLFSRYHKIGMRRALRRSRVTHFELWVLVLGTFYLILLESACAFISVYRNVCCCVQLQFRQSERLRNKQNNNKLWTIAACVGCGRFPFENGRQRASVAAHMKSNVNAKYKVKIAFVEAIQRKCSEYESAFVLNGSHVWYCRCFPVNIILCASICLEFCCCAQFVM